MPAPAMGSFAAGIYTSMADMLQAEPSLGYPFAYYLNAFAKMYQLMDDYGRDGILLSGKPVPGWGKFMDINNCPSEALPWLAQFVGATTQQGLTDTQQRARIAGVGGWSRGTLNSFVAAAQQYLTGAKTVTVRERDASVVPSNPAYGLTVITKTSETPDSSKVLAALLSQKPAGIVLNYQVLTGTDYQGLFGSYATYQVIYTTFTTYQGVLNNVPGT